MSESTSAEPIILKILSGVQSGAEVSLAPGEYTIGSGASDDIQLIDVSLKAAQGRLRISQGKIEIAGGSGPLVTAHGFTVEAGSDLWQEIEPLDIITAGTIRFALGPPSANWTTLSSRDEAPRPKANRPSGGPLGRYLPDRVFQLGKLPQLAAPVLILLLLAVAGIGTWYLSSGGSRVAPRVAGDDAETVRSLLDAFPFGKAVAVTREVDGTIYATGYVESNVERRALAGAIEKSGIPVRLRLGVLASLRNDIASLIQAEKVPVTFTLSSSGDLTLEGVILKDDDLARFLDQVKDTVIGINKINSNIRTAKSLLGEVTEVADNVHIEPWILFRIDGTLIEASGSLPDEKKDAWLRFLQTYSRRFSKDIALRSLVHLQNVNIGDPIVFDQGMFDRIARGNVDVNELLSGSNGQKPPTSAQVTGALGAGTQVATTAPPNVAPEDAGMRDNALHEWEVVRGDLSRFDRDYVLKKYLKQQANARNASCRPNSRLTAITLPQALFWLDLLSVSSEISLAKFGTDEQAFILEAALDPTLAAECLNRLGIHTDRPSLYIAEAATNPGFVRFVTRDLPTYGTDISGASLAAARYIQLRDGRKMREGAPPVGANELSIVGELGIAIEGKGGYSISLYGPQISWMDRPNALYGSHPNWIIWN